MIEPKFYYEYGSLDITGCEDVEIRIRKDGKVLWINTTKGCVFRICRIEGKITVEDERETK